MPSIKTEAVTVYEPGNSVFGRAFKKGPVIKVVFIWVGPVNDQVYAGGGARLLLVTHAEKTSRVFIEMAVAGVTLSKVGKIRSN